MQRWKALPVHGDRPNSFWPPFLPLCHKGTLGPNVPLWVLTFDLRCKKNTPESVYKLHPPNRQCPNRHHAFCFGASLKSWWGGPKLDPKESMWLLELPAILILANMTHDEWAINLNLIPPCYVVCTDPVGGILFPWVPPSLTCFYSQFSEWSLSVGSQLTWKGRRRGIKVKFDCGMSRNKREKESELIPTEVFRTRAYCNKRVLLASTFDKIVCPPAQPACCDSQESLRTFVFSSPDSHLF